MIGVSAEIKADLYRKCRPSRRSLNCVGSASRTRPVEIRYFLFVGVTIVRPAPAYRRRAHSVSAIPAATVMG